MSAAMSTPARIPFRRRQPRKSGPGSALAAIDHDEFMRLARKVWTVAPGQSLHESEDLVGDAIVALLERRVPCRAGDFSGYIVTAARHKALNRRRAVAHWGGSPFVLKDDDATRLTTWGRPTTFFLWPGCETHIDLLAIGEDEHARRVVSLELAALQDAADRVLLPDRIEWSRDMMIEAVKAFHARTGVRPTNRTFERAHQESRLPSGHLVVREWGSVGDLLRACGYKPKGNATSEARRKWTRETIRVAFCRWAQEHGRPPCSRELEASADGLPGKSTLDRVLGTGGAARAAIAVNRLCLDAGCRHTWATPIARRSPGGVT